MSKAFQITLTTRIKARLTTLSHSKVKAVCVTRQGGGWEGGGIIITVCDDPVYHIHQPLNVTIVDQMVLRLMTVV